MGLADVLIKAIEEHRDRINAAAERFDGPIELQLCWHPRLGKVETVIRPSDRLTPYIVQSCDTVHD